VHAKTYVFNPDGEESYMDYGKVFSILKDKGYNGWVSVEFEGPGDGDTGVQKTVQLIKKYM
jgi:sugar phosphate isomerase/epimerase